MPWMAFFRGYQYPCRVSRLFTQRLDRLRDAALGPLLIQGEKGLEKESLRISTDGFIAQTPHPRALGSALTHPFITTDYSEALLEFRTPPFAELRQTLSFLDEIHQFVYQNLGDELLWTASMPCLLKGDDSIPIAEYGRSNVGRMKHVYRRGLGYRYGRAMQAIAGVHFNYSLPEAFWPVYRAQEGDSRALQTFISEHYFALIRNFQRWGWLISYLFGASPAVCKSFVNPSAGAFPDFDAHTAFGPHATSLRMSDIGYKNKNQSELHVSYNSLEEYVATLTEAIQTPCADYQRIGVVVDGEHRQLNANILQIENEFYSFVRPKQIADSGEKPSLALKRRGVRYVEIRALDLGVHDPSGVNETELRFLEAFLLLCLFEDSPAMDALGLAEANRNQQLAACCGRDPALMLSREGERLALKDWARQICENMRGICELLDQGAGDGVYRAALDRQVATIEDPALTPSARVIEEMRNNRESFFDFALRVSQQHGHYYHKLPLTPERDRFFRDAARDSLDKQYQMERADSMSFEEYLERYFAQ
jgi:glutamate--cysteine ligase